VVEELMVLMILLILADLVVLAAVAVVAMLILPVLGEVERRAHQDKDIMVDQEVQVVVSTELVGAVVQVLVEVMEAVQQAEREEQAFNTPTLLDP
jgi:hypothetical protein